MSKITIQPISPPISIFEAYLWITPSFSISHNVNMSHVFRRYYPKLTLSRLTGSLPLHSFVLFCG